MTAPGCQYCKQGWVGYDDQQRLIPCPNCRDPHRPIEVTRFEMQARHAEPMPGDFRERVRRAKAAAGGEGA